MDAAEKQHDVRSGDVGADGALRSRPCREVLGPLAEPVDRVTHFGVLERGPADDLAERAVGGEQADPVGHEVPQRVTGVGGAHESVRRAEQPVEQLHHDGHEEVVLRREVPEDGAFGDTGPLGDLAHRHVHPALGEGLGRRPQEQSPIADAVRPDPLGHCPVTCLHGSQH